MAKSKELIEKGQESAKKFLILRGYEILEEGYEFGDGDAIDIVCTDGDAIVFCDVRTRTGESKGFPTDVCSKKRRERFEQAFIRYAKEHEELENMAFRADVISLLVISPDKALIRHAINALSVN